MIIRARVCNMRENISGLGRSYAEEGLHRVRSRVLLNRRIPNQIVQYRYGGVLSRAVYTQNVKQVTEPFITTLPRYSCKKQRLLWNKRRKKIKWGIKGRVGAESKNRNSYVYLAKFCPLESLESTWFYWHGVAQYLSASVASHVYNWSYNSKANGQSMTLHEQRLSQPEPGLTRGYRGSDFRKTS